MYLWNEDSPAVETPQTWQQKQSASYPTVDTRELLSVERKAKALLDTISSLKARHHMTQDLHVTRFGSNHAVLCHRAVIILKASDELDALLSKMV